MNSSRAVLFGDLSGSSTARNKCMAHTCIAFSKSNFLEHIMH